MLSGNKFEASLCYADAAKQFDVGFDVRDFKSIMLLTAFLTNTARKGNRVVAPFALQAMTTNCRQSSSRFMLSLTKSLINDGMINSRKACLLFQCIVDSMAQQPQMDHRVLTYIRIGLSRLYFVIKDYSAVSTLLQTVKDALGRCPSEFSVPDRISLSYYTGLLFTHIGNNAEAVGLLSDACVIAAQDFPKTI